MARCLVSRGVVIIIVDEIQNSPVSPSPHIAEQMDTTLSIIAKARPSFFFSFFLSQTKMAVMMLTTNEVSMSGEEE